MDAHQERLFFLKFLRNALNFRYPLSGKATALYVDTGEAVIKNTGLARVKNAEMVFSRIIPRSSWTYSLFVSGNHRFECLQTPDFSYLLASCRLEDQNYIVHLRDDEKISEIEAGPDEDTVGVLYLIHKGDRPVTDQLPSLLQKERENHPLDNIQTHDREWLERFDRNWWLLRQTTSTSLSVSGKALQEWLFAFFFAGKTKSKPLWTAEELQAFWDEYSLPIYTHLWRRRWRESPEEIVLFIISVMYHRPFWQTQAFRLLENTKSDPADQVVLNIIMLIQEKYLIYDAGHTRIFRVNPNDSGLIFKMENARFKITGRSDKKSALSTLAIKKDFEVTIDKAVVFEYDAGRRELVLKPELPHLSRIDFPAIQLVAGGTTVKIPMVWRQFTLRFRGMRLKFLLKARHWQITVKWTEDLKKIFLENREIQKETSNNRQKIYIDRLKSPRIKSTFFYFDGNGRQQQSLPPRNGVLQAAVLDKKGLLVTHGRVRAADGKKSHPVSFVRPGELPDISSHKFEIIVPKGAVIPLPVSPRDTDMIRQLKETPAPVLESHLVLSASRDLKDSFFRYTALHPLVVPRKQAALLYGAIMWHIIITDDIPVDRCRPERQYFVEKRGNSTLIYMPEAGAEKLFREYFTKHVP